jgi:hypothetical protein
VKDRASHVSAIGLLPFVLLIVSALVCISRGECGASSTQAYSVPTVTADEYAYLPLVARPYVCPTGSANEYQGGIAYQRDFDNPVRPAAQHADKNIELRGYVLNVDPQVAHDLVDYGSDDDTQPPQLATLFSPPRVPALVTVYRVHHWDWEPSPRPGTRAGPIMDYRVTALGMETTPGETLHVPQSGYDIGGDPPMEVLVIFADEDTITLRYSRDDSAAPPGYTVHIDNVCTDPNLLMLYKEFDQVSGPRYVYKPPHERPYTYPLSNLAERQPLGTASSEEIVVAIADTGSFQDPRSLYEWWQVRPGYPDGVTWVDP